MGACQFVSTSYGKTAQEAYNQAVEDAQYEYGHEAYNGTISTTHGFKMIGKVKTYAEAAQMSRKIDWDESGIGKWEDCGCIEIAEGDGHHAGQTLYYFFGWAAEQDPMDERLLIRQQWHSLRRDLDRYRSHRGVDAERTMLREELITRLDDLRKRLITYYSSDPHIVEELRRGRGLLALEFVVRKATDKLIPEEELHGPSVESG